MSMCKEVNFYSVKQTKSSNEKMNSMRKEHKFCDLNIKIGSKIICVHKIVLTSSSEYFKNMLTNDFNESQVNEITINEMIAPSAFEFLIDYMYTKNLKITEHNVEDLLVASNYFLLFDIFDECVRFMKEIMNVDNCHLFHSIVHNLKDINELQEFCKKFISNNFVEISNSNDFLLLSFDQIKDIIKNDHLYAKEEQVYEATILWVNHDVENRSQLLPELLQEAVRLPLIPLKYLFEIINEEKLILSNSKCLELLNNVIKMHAYKNIGIKELKSSLCNDKQRTTAQVLVILYCIKSRMSELQWYNILNNKLYPTTFKWSASMDTSIILNDGRIFHLEQETSNTFANIYNGDSKKWERTSFANFKHENPRVIQFDNRVYVISNVGVEYYYILNESWYTVQFKLPMCDLDQYYILHMELAVVSNVIYIISNDKCFCYDPNTDVGKLIHPISTTKTAFSLCSLNNQLYLIGGLNNVENIEYLTSDVERYDSETDTWIRTTSMNQDRCSSGAIAINGLMYIIGSDTSSKTDCINNNIEYYDPQTGLWTYCEEKIISSVEYFARAFVLGVESNIHPDNILNYYSI